MNDHEEIITNKSTFDFAPDTTASEMIKSSFKTLQLPVFIIIYAIFIFGIVAVFLISVSLSLFNIELDPWIFRIVNQLTVSIIILILFFVMLSYLEEFWEIKDPRPSSLSSSNETLLAPSIFDGQDTTGKHLAIVFLLIASLILGYLIFDIIIETGKQIITPTVASSTDSIFIPIELIFAGFITTVIIAPIFEEIIFRRYFQSALDRTELNDWIHYVVQAFTFILFHTTGDILANPPAEFFLFRIIFTGLIAVYFTWLVKKYQTLIYPIILHALFNLFLLGLSLGYAEYRFYLDRMILDIILLLLAIMMTLLILILLITKANWLPKRPALPKISIPTKSNSIFILTMVIITGIALSVEFIIGLALSIQILSFSISVSIILMVISFVLLIYWALKVNNLPWNLVY